MLLVVIGAPLLSFIWTFIAYWFVSAGLYTGNKLVEKGKTTGFKIQVQNKGILPVPEIIVRLKTDGHVSINSELCSFNSVIWGKTEEDKEMFTVYSGLTEIEIESVVITDFFGVFRLKLRRSQYEAQKKLEIGILPTINTLEQEDDWLLSARSAAFDGEEPEDTVDDRSVTFGGFPGFEHRDYVEGDPLKRINYKLSARIGRLQVRLDEEQAVAGISMYLSTVLPDDLKKDEPYIKYTSLCLEEFIGVAQHLYMLDFSVKVYIPNEEGFELTDGRSIEVLREKLAFQKFAPAEVVDDSIINAAKGSLIACLTYNENSVIEMLKKYSYLEGNSVSVYVSSIEKGRRL